MLLFVFYLLFMRRKVNYEKLSTENSDVSYTDFLEKGSCTG